MAENNYYKQIEKFALLTAEEEKTLITKAYCGDENAKRKLVEANLRFVVKIAHRYKSFMELEDLIIEGTMGLMHAVEKIDPANNTKVITYAANWITAYIQKAIRETSKCIKFPGNKFNEMKKSKWNIASLDKNIGKSEDDEVTLASFIPDENTPTPEEEFCNKETKILLNEMLKNLKQKEQAVIIMRYSLDGEEPMNLSKIGTLMGYSRERIRQIEKNALESLRKDLTYSYDYINRAA